jgi:phosphoribosyl 1,2-cyclic phosphodiesterase
MADDEPLPVDLLMVSHVDDDHIQGFLELTRELIEAPRAPLCWSRVSGTTL